MACSKIDLSESWFFFRIACAIEVHTFPWYSCWDCDNFPCDSPDHCHDYSPKVQVWQTLFKGEFKERGRSEYKV